MRKLKNSIIGNAFFILLICAGIYILFFSSLSWMTNHGQSTTVPNVVGQDMNTVIAQLEKQGFAVDVDSVYQPTNKPLEVLSIEPKVGSSVKVGRTIFLIVNQARPPMIDMPNLVNLSLRSASLLIKSNKLVMGDTVYRPDIANGAVLEMLVNGKIIKPGTQLYQGTKIDLVVGDGFAVKQIVVPDVINLTYDEAISVLKGNNLTYTIVWDGAITDSSTAVIYMQMPMRRNEYGEPVMINEGENVDIRIRQSNDGMSSTNTDFQ